MPFGGELISAPVATKPEVSVKEAAAKEFLSSLRRQRRQLWDRSQPDVQQWYQQFLYLGFDEAVSRRLSRVGRASRVSGCERGCTATGAPREKLPCFCSQILRFLFLK